MVSGPSRWRRRAGVLATTALLGGVAPALASAPAAAAPPAVTVDCTGSDDSALQTALDATAPGTEGGATTEITISGLCIGSFLIPTGATLHLHGDGGGDDVLDGGGEARPLTAEDVTLTLSDLAVQNGVAVDESGAFDGAGGGLFITNQNGERVVIDNVVFRDNEASAPGGGGLGGGAVIGVISQVERVAQEDPADFGAAAIADAEVVVTNSIFGGPGDANTASGDQDTFLLGLGGGLLVASDADVHIEGSTFDSNVATNGGGLAILPVGPNHTELRDNMFTRNTLRTSTPGCTTEHLGGGLLLSPFFLAAGRAPAAFEALELGDAPEAPEGTPTATQVGNTFALNVIEPAYQDSTACNTTLSAQQVQPEAADGVGFVAGGGEATSNVWVASRDDQFVGNLVENGFDNGETVEPGEAEGAGLAIEDVSSFYAENLVSAANQIRDAEGSGGGVYIGAVATTTLQLVNSTVTGNTVPAGVVGAGIGGGGAADSVVLSNSIVAGNTGDGSDVGGVASLEATHSDVCDLEDENAPAPGDGNICADPMLANVAAGDVHQTAASPTVDAGSNALVPGDLDADYEGDERVADDVVDMGADERVVSDAPPGSIDLDDGYCLLAEDGGVFTFGGCQFLGAAADGPIIAPQSLKVLNAPMVGMAMHPNDNGYWMAGADGGVFTFGSAAFLGSMGGTPLNSPVVGIATTPSGNGYYLVAADGGIFTFGDAPFLGSMGSQHLNAPIVNIVVTPSGMGYWLVASDGGVFSFGDATFFGSMGDKHLNQPVIGMASRPGGLGYWLVATDGGIFSFGDAPFLGSMGAVPLNQPVVAMKSTSTGLGYYMVATDGGIFTFGDAPFLGSMGGTPLNQPVVDMTG